MALIFFSLLARPAHSACARLEWSCFNSSVAIVARAADGHELAFCSGVAVSVRRVLTAGHCAVSFAQPDVDHLDIYLDALVDKTLPGVGRVSVGGLHVNAQYNRPKSYYFHDRGIIELDSDLPSGLNFPIVASVADAAMDGVSTVFQDIVVQHLIGGAKLERIGFGARPSARTGGSTEHRRTWLSPVVDSLEPDAIVTVDRYAVPGDSGGPLYLFVPGTGLFLVGLHSTWNPPADRVYSPRVY